MAGLSVIFKAIDEISDKLDAMSSAGNKTLDAFDKLSDTADKAFANTTEETQKATEAMEKAAQATDYWTDAVGNYDKGCLEAVYSTEELVNMGFKTEDALKAEADAAEEAQDKTEQLGEEMDKTSKKSEDFGDKSKNAVVGLDDILATVGIVAALNKIADAFSNASDKAAEFETNVAMVSTVADTTVLSADQLATQISGLSKDTAKNVNELADATYNAISAGVATEGAVETVGEVSYGSDNSNLKVYGVGECTIIQDSAAANISFSSFFPKTYFSGCNYRNIPDPNTAVAQILAMKNTKKPVRLTLTGGMGISMYATIEKFKTSEVGGDPGTVQFDITLKEYREITMRQIKVNVTTQKATISQSSPRVDNTPAAQTYAVKKGDCLWNIAKKFYGSGAKYTVIYNANKGVIGSNPNLIYPGQVYTIPAA